MRDALGLSLDQDAAEKEAGGHRICVRVQRRMTMARHVHPAVMLNAVTLAGGYFVFFFRVETHIVCHATVRWENGEQEVFTVEQKGRYFHPGYLPPPPTFSHPDLFYDDLREREYRTSGEAVAQLVLARAVARER